MEIMLIEAEELEANLKLTEWRKENGKIRINIVNPEQYKPGKSHRIIQ